MDEVDEMHIDGRELFFKPQAPLQAWRLFRVREDAGGPLLSSPMYHNPDPPRWPHAVNEATCYKGHRAPEAGCRCGIYAAIPGTLDSLPGYLIDTAYERDPWAYAEVLCTGRVFVDMRGVRAERAQVVRIALAEHCWRIPDGPERTRRSLSARYGVPVEGLTAVPDWLSTNQRSQGPPADDVPLDLEMDRLVLLGRRRRQVRSEATGGG